MTGASRSRGWTCQSIGRATAERISEELAKTAMWTENWTRQNAMVVPRLLLSKQMINDVYVIPCPPGIIGQDYVMGLFDLAPDEALVLETELPEQAHYWSFHLTDEMTASIDSPASMAAMEARMAIQRTSIPTASSAR